MKLLSQVEAERLIDNQQEGDRKEWAIGAHNYWVQEGLYETQPAQTLDGSSVMWCTMTVDGYWYGNRNVTFEEGRGHLAGADLFWASQAHALDNHMERRTGQAVPWALKWFAEMNPVYFARGPEFSYVSDQPILPSKEESDKWFARLATEPEIALPSEEKIAELNMIDMVDNNRYNASQMRKLEKIHPLAEPNWFRHLIASQPALYYDDDAQPNL